MSYEKQGFASGDVLYATQLNAMDDQIADNEEEITGLKSALSEDEILAKIQFNKLLDSISFDDWIQLPLKISTTAVGSVLDINDLGDSNNYYRQLIPCIKNDIFEVCSYTASTYGQYAFLDSSYVVLEKNNSSSSSDVHTIVAPEDGFLAVQGHKNYTYTAIGLYKNVLSVPLNQGTENANKCLIVDANGLVIPGYASLSDELRNLLLTDKSYSDWIQFPFKISTTAVGSTLDINDLGDSNNYYRQLIPCSKGDIFDICSYTASAYGQYAFLNESYVVLSKNDSSSASDVHRAIAPDDGYLAVQGHKNYTMTANALYKDNAAVLKHQGIENSGKYLLIDDSGNVIPDDSSVIDKISNKQNVTENTGFYINASGVKTSSTSFMMSEPVYIKSGFKILVFARGYNTAVTIIAQTHLGETDFFPLVRCVDSEERWYEYTTTRDGYYVISGNKATHFIMYIIPSSPEKTDVSLSMFQKFGVIGDSYASGVIYKTWGNSKQRYEYSWGQILARKCGTQCTNYSSGGLSTRTWLTSSSGLTKLLNNSPEDIYYCALGINDYGQLGLDYLGSILDIHDDSSLNADTFYGNYGKIISNIKTHAPYALIVLFTCANTAEPASQFNTAIIDIAKHFSIPYIVQAEDPFFSSSIYTSMMGGHPTSIGYGGMCNAFERLLKGAIELYPNYFKTAYAQWED